MISLRKTEYFISARYNEDKFDKALDDVKSKRDIFIADNGNIQEILLERAEYQIIPSNSPNQINRLFVIITLSYYPKP